MFKSKLYFPCDNSYHICLNDNKAPRPIDLRYGKIISEPNEMIIYNTYGEPKSHRMVIIEMVDPNTERTLYYSVLFYEHCVEKPPIRRDIVILNPMSLIKTH